LDDKISLQKLLLKTTNNNEKSYSEEFECRLEG